jgi:hypothetical protein
MWKDQTLGYQAHLTQSEICLLLQDKIIHKPQFQMQKFIHMLQFA